MTDLGGKAFHSRTTKEIKNQMTDLTKKEGVKYDKNKPRVDLIPPKAELSLARVLTFGAAKYDEENWRKLDNLQSRYIAASLRHINAFRQGKELDDESGEHHLGHALACLMFVLEDILLEDE